MQRALKILPSWFRRYCQRLQLGRKHPCGSTGPRLRAPKAACSWRSKKDYLKKTAWMSSCCISLRARAASRRFSPARSPSLIWTGQPGPGEPERRQHRLCRRRDQPPGFFPDGQTGNQTNHGFARQKNRYHADRFFDTHFGVICIKFCRIEAERLSDFAVWWKCRIFLQL